MLEEVKDYITAKLKKQIPSHIFLDRMRVGDEEFRQSFIYNNPNYIPFYYWLGTILKPKTLIEIGFGLGFMSGNFLKSCKTVNYFLAIQEKKSGEYYSSRLGKSNVLDNYKGDFYIHTGDITDDVLKSHEFDLALISEQTTYDKYRLYFDFLQMSKEGIMVVEHLNKSKSCSTAFKDFCRSINREPVYINTAYGIGVVNGF